MALINTAGILAGHRGFRVLVLDLDLEAPGLSYLDPGLPDLSSAQPPAGTPLVARFRGIVERCQRARAGSPICSRSRRPSWKVATPRTSRFQLTCASFQTLAPHHAGRSIRPRLYSTIGCVEPQCALSRRLGEPLIRAFKKEVRRGRSLRLCAGG